MGTAHHKSMVKAIVERLESLMTIGESRGAAKEAAREAGKKVWAFSTGRIHSYKTRQVYQEQAIRFGRWARATSCFTRHTPQFASSFTSELLATFHFMREGFILQAPVLA